ncbi:MAG: ABC transporter ATP-binding protein [candidate division NC10 bacterium]|nr:ABC transporter ATP-binding protein [candidate division NC10 bacterium]
MEVRAPQEAIRLGIGMVFQHFTLVPSLTVAENVILGLSSPRFFLRIQAIESRIEELASRYRLKVDPKAKVWQLSVGEQQRVEILKLLYRGARILILDEPTSVLTPQEAGELFMTLRSMAGEGHAIIFITHKLDEVMAIADRITVLRQGTVVATLDREEATRDHLARLMVGREMLIPMERPPSAPGEVILSVTNLSAKNDKGLPALKGITLEVRAGEVLGIAGVAGNGQRELGEVIAGLRPATAGQVKIRDRDMTNAPPGEIIAQGVSYLPEDRQGMGLVPEASILENLLLKAYRTPPLARGPLLDYQAAWDQGRRLLETFHVAAPRPDAPVRVLSGGNLQRLLLARELSTDPVLLLASYPTRGLDVGAEEAIRRLLLFQRQRGAAVLLISEDLDEIFSLSDQIAVMYEGEIMGLMKREDADLETIGLMMAGIRRGEKPPPSEVRP